MLKLKNVSKTYVTGDLEQVALNNVSLNLRDNEFVSILGPSGSGKTTLLNIIGGLDKYDDGDLIINGISTKKYSDRDWDSYRNHTIGFVFQSYNLIPHQSVLSNVELALTISGISKPERRKRAKKALEEVGLGDQLHKKPNQMSGGQMQRVAIARALVNDPDILLADEPTGALDSETSVQVMELIQKISENRLVIMVTHNPELAEQYSSRIVKVKDGKIIDDSNPYEPEEDLSEEPKHKNMGKSSMSFKTALSLSFNNLRTKKARTLLTSFAGSIGIIGIALILALSNGIQVYIDAIQRDALTSYPITIESSTTDIATAMGSLMTVPPSETTGATDEIIRSNNSMAQMIESFSAGVWKNDLKSFSAFLNSENSKINQYATSTQFIYDNIMNIYSVADDGTLNQVSPSPVMSMLEGMTVGGITLDSSMMSSYDAVVKPWQELMNNQDVLNEQYEVLKGTWPQNYNEVVLIVDQNNQVNDFVLQGLGVTSSADMMQALMAIQGGGTFEAKNCEFTYDEILNRKYKLVLQPDYFEYDKELKTWNDMSGDEEYVKKLVENGEDIKIVGIVRPTGDTVTTGGIGYTSELTKYIINKTNESEIVKQQIANPKIDVFTGIPFEKEKTEEKVSPVSVVPVTKPALTAASMSVKSSAPVVKQLAVETEANEEETTVPSSNMFDFANMPSITEDELYAMIDEKVPEEEREEVRDIVSTMLKTVYSMSDRKKLASYFDKVLEGQEIEGVGEISGEQAVNMLAMMDKSTKLKMLGAMISQDMPSTGEPTTTPGTTDDPVVDNPDNPDKPVTPDNPDNPQPDTPIVKPPVIEEPQPYAENYEAALKILGVVDLESPKKINIYANNFEAKEAISNIISEYNETVINAGAVEKEIKYTDYIGLMLSSVTTIIDVISYILIAFVAVSLVVSSIMIGIITYISVLERTKEIGVLRAIGASKRDVSNMFNAETIIIGLASGIFGILITYLLCIPINIILHSLTGIATLGAILPLPAAFILIGISALLTLFAGIIPSKSAARKDPVVALRTE